MDKKQTKKAVLLVNVGTPDSPTPPAVRRYLSEFLNDPLVIDLPWILRKFLVNFIIIPFRVRKSTELYKLLWTNDGSPLLTNMAKLAEKLSNKQDKYSVFYAMRYGNPALKNVLQQIENEQFSELVVFPLYPQYSGSTTQTTINKILRLTKKWKQTKIRFIEQFYHYSSFIEAFVSKVRRYELTDYDHILFSYHSLPTRQIEKGHKQLKNITCNCSVSHSEQIINCYKHSCLHLTALLAKKMQLFENEYSMCFQSRMSKDWLEPFTDKTLIDLAKQNKKKILIISPSFVADCLETTIEIGADYKKMFLEAGGERLDLVDSLNYSSEWVEAIIDILERTQ